MKDISFNQYTNTLKLLKILQRHQVSQFYHSPGYRCLPILYTLKRLNETSISSIDERQTAFRALGFMKAKKARATLICTSGTAGAHFYPSVIEAKMTNTPLLILTADRPKRLRGSESNQTINQIELFGDYATFIQLDMDQTDLPWASIESTITQGYLESRPLHFNLSFEEPLEFDGEESFFKQDLTLPERKNSKHSPRFSDFKKDLNPHSLTVIGELYPEEREMVAKLLPLIKGPCYLDLSSGLYGHRKCLLSPVANIEYSLDLVKDAHSILHLGGKLISNNYYRVLDLEDTPKVTWVARYFPDKILQERYKQCFNFNYDQLKSYFSSQKSEPISTQTKQSQYQSYFPLIRSLYSQFSDGLFYIGNSSLIRAFSEFDDDPPKDIDYIFQRGVSGIDGMIAGAKGICDAYPDRQVVTVIGDLQAFHDLSSFFHDFPVNLKVIIFNNFGGRIFERLPIKETLSVVGDEILTPHQLSFYKVLSSSLDIKSFQLEEIDWDQLSSFQVLEVIAKNE